MNTKIIRISEADHESIRLRLLALADDPRAVKTLAKLRSEIDRALVVKARPPDVVGLQTLVSLLDLDSDEVDHYTLTTPEQADPAAGRISVFAPLGTAILGYAEGDEFSWEMPGGTRRLRIVSVTAPQATANV